MRLLYIFVILSTVFTTTTIFGKDLSFSTFNAGLAHTFVPLAKQRRGVILEQLSILDTDVLCLQEVWTEPDREAFAEVLGKKYKYSFFKEVKQTRSKNTPTCHITDLFGEGKFISCLRSECDGKKGDAFTSCLINKCGNTLEKLKNKKRECAAGLLAQVGKSTIMALINVFNPFKSAGVFAFEGSDGVMVFSKYPLGDKKVIDYTPVSTTNRRRALMSSITINNKKVNFACTHLTANLTGTAPYTGLFKSWENENASQIKSLITSLKSKSSLVLGDFNCGIKNKDLSGDFEDNCKLFKKAGFENYYENHISKCTFCTHNSLVDSKKHTKDYLIDHIFTMGVKVRSSKRILDNKFLVKDQEKQVKSHLSDHFGLKLTIDM